MMTRREDRIRLIDEAEELLVMGEVRVARRLASALRAAGPCANAAQRLRVQVILRVCGETAPLH